MAVAEQMGFEPMRQENPRPNSLAVSPLKPNLSIAPFFKK